MRLPSAKIKKAAVPPQKVQNEAKPRPPPVKQPVPKAVEIKQPVPKVPVKKAFNIPEPVLKNKPKMVVKAEKVEGEGEEKSEIIDGVEWKKGSFDRLECPGCK